MARDFIVDPLLCLSKVGATVKHDAQLDFGHPVFRQALFLIVAHEALMAEHCMISHLDLFRRSLDWGDEDKG